MIQQKVSLFQCLTSVPSKAVALDEVVRLIRHDSSVASKTEGYRTMAAVLGKEKADEEVKRKLMPAVSVGVLFDGNGRGAANVLGFTGLALCDIDHIGSDDAVEAAFAKAAHDAHTLMAYRTVSGRGLLSSTVTCGFRTRRKPTRHPRLLTLRSPGPQPF